MREIEAPVPAEDQQCVKGSAYDASLHYDTSPSGRVDWSQPTDDTGASGASSQGENASAE